MDEKDIIKDKLLNHILNYKKISHDNWNYGLSEAVDIIHKEVEDLFENPLTWEMCYECMDCVHYKDKDYDYIYSEGDCLKFNKQVDGFDCSCDDFEWK